MWLPNEPYNIDHYDIHDIRELIADLKMIREYIDSSIAIYEKEYEKRVSLRPDESN